MQHFLPLFCRFPLIHVGRRLEFGLQLAAAMESHGRPEPPEPPRLMSSLLPQAAAARARLDCLAKSLSLVTREAQIPPDRENHFFSFSPAGLEVNMKPNVVQSALMWISCK